MDTILKETHDEPSLNILENKEEVNIFESFMGFIVPENIFHETIQPAFNGNKVEIKMCKFYNNGF